ncbi:MAG: glycosyl transferase [Rhodobacteraceae bacterium]|nr:glycosyl transferase [Paracoccaceae bacterium]
MNKLPIHGLRRILLASSVSLLAIGAQAQTLRIMQSEPPRSMDPADQTASFTQVVLAPMYEGLIGRSSDMEIVPVLATDWSHDDSGLVWTFNLREGVTFHDGTALDSAAVVNSFQRLLDPARGLAAAGRMRAVLADVEADGDMQVNFTLHSPYAGFVDLMATAVGWIVSPTADGAGNLGTAAVGTGPFRFQEWESGEYVSQTAFDGYWGDQPQLEGLHFTWSSEPSVLSMAVQSGEVDVVNPLPPIFAQTIANNPELDLIDQPGSSMFWVSLNVQSDALEHQAVRQALNFATNKDALVQALLRGYGTPATSPLSPTNPAWDDTLNPYPYDVEKALELLDAAGFADGFSMSVAVQEPEASIAEALQAMWGEIGVDLQIRRLESGVWSEAAFNDPDAKAADGLDAVIASWSSGSFNSDLQFRPLYATSSWAPGGANLGFFSSGALDDLIDRAASELDADARRDLYVEAQKLVNEEAPHVLLYSTRDLAAMRQSVNGVWLIPGGVVQVAGASITD